MAHWLDATVKKITWWNDKLFSLTLHADIDPFIAGQYTKLALNINQERIARAYSFVNPPHSNDLEFYLIKVDDGALSLALSQLSEGDTVQISQQSNGFFTLDEVPKAEQLWMLSTGTAIGPFLSILQEDEVYSRYQHINLVHCVRQHSDLSYQPLIHALQNQHTGLNYIPIVTREENTSHLRERIPALIQSGALFEAVQLSASPDVAQFMVCGNPQMVKQTSDCLSELGYSRNRRRSPGHITVEQYW